MFIYCDCLGALWIREGNTLCGFTFNNLGLGLVFNLALALVATGLGTGGVGWVGCATVETVASLDLNRLVIGVNNDLRGSCTEVVEVVVAAVGNIGILKNFLVAGSLNMYIWPNVIIVVRSQYTKTKER